MRVPLACGLAPLLAALLAGCSASPPGGELAVAVVGEGELAEQLAAEASRATLVTRAAGGELAPGLATSWRFLDDGDDLILRLAPVRWPGRSDGGAPGPDLVARDVVAGLRRTGAAGRQPLAAAGLAARGTARAPIARVVELSPRPATPFLLDWLAEPALAVRDRGGRLFPGPYRLARDGDAIRLDRRSEIPRPDARAASIRITRQEPAAAIAGFAAGRQQLVLGEGLAGLGAARAAGQGRALVIEAAHGVIGLAINARPGGLADACLRRALMLATDAAVLAGRGGPLQPQARLWDGLPAPDDDRARPPAERRALATALLAEAGFGPARPLRLTLLVPAGPDHQQLADGLAAAWSPLGIALSLQRVRQGGMAAARAAGQHDLALVELVARVPDGAAHLAQWRCARARPCNRDADRLLDAAAAAGNDLAARAAAINAAEQALMIDAAFIPLLRPLRWALVADGVEGFRPNALGHHPLGRIARSGAG